PARTMDRRHRQWSRAHVQPRLGQNPRADDRLGERQRDRVAAGRAHDDVGITPRAAGAALRFGEQRQRQAILLDRLPEAVGPLALLGGLEDVFRHEIGEETCDNVTEDGPQLVHRSPSPLAMMPRRISRVPPRSENDGARCMRKPSTCWRSLPESIVGSTPSRVWTISGISCSKVVPTDVATAASRLELWLAWGLSVNGGDYWSSLCGGAMSTSA